MPVSEESVLRRPRPAPAGEAAGPGAAGACAQSGAALALALEVALSLAGAQGERGDGTLTYSALKRELKEAVANDPFDATVVTVLGGAFLFYLAEKDQNPKVTSYWDALVFVSTSLSVGYADIFARTSAGKAIAAALMTFGPALSGALFEGPAAPATAKGREGAPAGRAERAEENRASAELVQLQRIIVEKLDAIVLALRREP
jgi:voltage-gated potassium channel